MRFLALPCPARLNLSQNQAFAESLPLRPRKSTVLPILLEPANHASQVLAFNCPVSYLWTWVFTVCHPFCDRGQRKQPSRSKPVTFQCRKFKAMQQASRSRPATVLAGWFGCKVSAALWAFWLPWPSRCSEWSGHRHILAFCERLVP